MLSGDDHLPLVDKTLESLYPSGSTIKPSMAMALLNAGIDRNQQVNCTGAFQLGNHTFHCDKRHGPVDMDAAVVQSCDVYFYSDVPPRRAREKLSPMVRSMGFGEKFDLPIDNQRYGTIPDPDWMMRKYHREWQRYDTVNMSIGQGMVLINPLQLAVMASRLATGNRVVPRLLKSKPIVPQTQLAVDQDHLELHPQGDVRRGRPRHGRGGQAAARRHPDGRQDRHRADSQSRAPANAATTRRRHGSFATTRCSWRFVPFDNPRYAAATIVEHGGFGAAVAAPLVRDTLPSSTTSRRRSQRWNVFEQSIGGTLDATARAQDRRVALRQRTCRRSDPQKA